jgi:hypothetical protein
LLLVKASAVAVAIEVNPVGVVGKAEEEEDNFQIVTMAISPAANEGVVAVIDVLELPTIVLDCAVRVKNELAPYHSLNDIVVCEAFPIRFLTFALFIRTCVPVVSPASTCMSFREIAPEVGSAIRLCHML